jgi:uncharacterized protein (TIGR03000 family)
MRQPRIGWAIALGAAALALLPAAAPAQVSINVGRYGGVYYGYTPGYYAYGAMPGYYGYSPYTWGYAPVYSTFGSWSNPGYVWGNYNWGGYSYPSYPASSYYSGAPATSYYGSGYPAQTGSNYSYGAPDSAQPRNSAMLNVRVPDANADVWVEGKLTQQRGTQREYVSPSLDPDKSYTYQVRARWSENGRDVERTRTVPIRANGTATVDFTAPANNSRVDEIDKGVRTPEKGTRPPDTSRPEKP